MSRPHRHHISEIDAALPDTAADLADLVGLLTLEQDPPVSGDQDSVELIDRPSLERPLIGLPPSGPRPSIHRDPHLSAIPRAEAMGITRRSLPWGLGTDGWPRRGSRHVRLFFGDHRTLALAAAGRRWDRLVLRADVEVCHDDVETHVVPGLLRMPYPSRPLDVELRLQPFEARFARVDLVLTSRRRYPRRYFDVASLALTSMQQIEASPAHRAEVSSRRDPTPAGTQER